MMRICRICLQPDLANTFKKVYDDNSKIAIEIYLLFKIVITELTEPAIICRKCEKHVIQATELRKLCLIAERHFKQNFSTEHYTWHENLRELKALEPKKKQEPKIVVQEQKTDDVQEANTEIQEARGMPAVETLKTRRSTRRSISLIKKSVDEPATPTLHELKILVASNSPTVTHKPTEVSSLPESCPLKKELHEDSCSPSALTEILDDDLNETEDFDYINKLTMDQIRELTEMIEKLLPIEKEVRKRDRKRKKIEALANQPTTPKIKINLRSQEIVRSGSSPKRASIRSTRLTDFVVE